MTAPLNPDCAYSKHRACSGTAWDEDLDVLTDCACDCHYDDAVAGEHGPDEDLRRAHDEHPCRCAHHRETEEQR